MRRRKRIAVWAALGLLVAALSVVAAGCGGGDDEGAGGDSQVEGLGSNIIFVVAGSVEFGAAPSISRLELDDVDELGRVLGNPEAVATTISSGTSIELVTCNPFFSTSKP